MGFSSSARPDRGVPLRKKARTPVRKTGPFLLHSRACEKKYGHPEEHIRKEFEPMPKTYILDTNVLLHNPKALFVFEENSVVIPLAVIEEIDSQKRRQDEIGRNARIVSRILDSLRVNGQLSSGVNLPTGGALRVEVNHQEAIDFPRGLDSGKVSSKSQAFHEFLGRRKTSNGK
jgi:hypothetical protein